jgi:hypothetical protein
MQMIMTRRYNLFVKVFAERLKKAGKLSMLIMGAVMHKLLHVITVCRSSVCLSVRLGLRIVRNSRDGVLAPRSVYDMKYIVPVFILLFLVGCERSTLTEVKSASGKTPVKYVICSQGDSNCLVAARFKDLDKCQSYKDWADMRCDQIFMPVKMTCVQNDGPKVGVTYCTM